MFIRHNTDTGLFGVYASRKDAGSQFPVYASMEELAKANASIADMAKFYNKLTGENVRAFRDKATAARRIWDAAVGKNEEGGAPEAPAPDAPEAPAPDAPEAPEVPNEAKKRGRQKGTGKNAGKTVKALKQVNPRRAGTKGWYSYNILLDNPNGMLYEDFVKAGGRPVDIDWDVAHKHAEMS